MLQEHLLNGSNQNFLYQRRYLGKGRYYQKGICKGIQEGDEFITFTSPNSSPLIVDKIISRCDSKGKFRNPEHSKEALYEAELHDPTFDPQLGYIPQAGFGF
jgi:hypothetical protein